MREKKGNLTELELPLSCPRTGCFREQQTFPTSNFYSLWQKLPSFLQFPPYQGPPSPRSKVSIPHLFNPSAMGMSGWDQGLPAKPVTEDKDSHISLLEPVFCY